MKFGFEQNGPLEIGLYTLGDHAPNPHTNKTIPAKQRLKEIIELAKTAEKYGLDYFGLGESHQQYFVSQAHAVVLGAIAAETEKIKFGSSATIISTSDPVRVYENFATLDLISDGRAEIVAGRASRPGLFKLLGYDMQYYEELFEENFDLLRLINEKETISWQGRFREPLENATVLPRAEREIPIWRAVGGTPTSAIAAGRKNTPMMLANLAGPVAGSSRTISLYRQAAEAAGHNVDELPITAAGFFFVDQTVEKAIETAYPYINNSLRHSNGSGFPAPAMQQAALKESILNVGSVDSLIEKILYQHEQWGIQRYIAQLDLGGVPFEKQKEMVQILGEEIAPVLRRETAR